MGECVLLRQNRMLRSDSPKEEQVSSMYLYGTPSESGNIGLRVGDAVTLYDGVVLMALPEWDKTEYPYVCLERYYTDNIGWSATLCMSKEPPYYDNVIFQKVATVPAPRLWCKNDNENYDTPTAWTELQEYDSDYTVSVVNEIIWANVDILKTNGDYYVKASDPIAVGEIVDYDGDIPIYEVIK